MAKSWLQFYSWDAAELKMLVNGIKYIWHNVSSQFVEEVQNDLNKRRNQGRILKRIEEFYGKGVKENNHL